MGGAQGQGGPQAQTALVGIHLDQEPRLPGSALCRLAHRSRDCQHDARRDDRRILGPRNRRTDRRHRRRRATHSSLEELGELGIDLADVAQVLEDEGVASFANRSTSCSRPSNQKARSARAERASDHAVRSDSTTEPRRTMSTANRPRIRQEQTGRPTAIDPETTSRRCFGEIPTIDTTGVVERVHHELETRAAAARPRARGLRRFG